MARVHFVCQASKADALSPAIAEFVSDTGGKYASMHRGTDSMITSRHRNSTPDLVARVPEAWPRLFVDASEALRRGRGESRPAFLMPTTPAAGQLADAFFGDAPLSAFAGAFLGCLATEYFSAFGIVPAIASALATVLLCGPLLVTRTSGLFGEAFFPALYGGTFAGMTPIIWLSGSPSGVWAASTAALSVALSLICGLVFFVVARLDHRSAAPFGIGCGGRLGAIAVLASFLFVELVRTLGADANRFHTIAAGAYDVEPWSVIQGFFACLIGSAATLLVLRQRRVADSPVPTRIFVASVAALLGLVVLHPRNSGDATAMDAFYAGCFLGMSTLDRLKGWLQAVSGALVLMVVLVPVRAFLPGFGGGLGLAAFIAVILLVASNRATASVRLDMPWAGRRFVTAMASAVIAVFLTIGLISAEPVAEEVPISVGTMVLDRIAELSDASPDRLVLGKPAPGAADDLIPISISLNNATADDVVVLTGLPSGATLVTGRPLASGGWLLLTGELDNAAVRPAPGFVGGADITVELRHADQSVVDRQQRHLEWVARASPDLAPPLAEALAAGHDADKATDDFETVFGTFLRSRGQAAAPLENLGMAQPTPAAGVKRSARGQHVQGQAVASTGPHWFALPFARGAVRPPPAPVRPADISARKKVVRAKSTLPEAHPHRPAAVPVL